MAALDDAISSLSTEVANNTTVTGSVKTLVTGMAAALAAALANAQAAGATPAQLQAIQDLHDTLAANDAAAAALVVANTAAAPPSNPTPAPLAVA